MASKPTFGARNHSEALVAAHSSGTSTMEVEHGTAVGPSVLAHTLDDGGPHATAPMGRVDRHGDFGASYVVAQRQLHHAHTENRTSEVARREEIEALRPTARR